MCASHDAPSGCRCQDPCARVIVALTARLRLAIDAVWRRVSTVAEPLIGMALPTRGTWLAARVIGDYTPAPGNQSLDRRVRQALRLQPAITARSHSVCRSPNR